MQIYREPKEESADGCAYGAANSQAHAHHIAWTAAADALQKDSQPEVTGSVETCLLALVDVAACLLALSVLSFCSCC